MSDAQEQESRKRQKQEETLEGVDKLAEVRTERLKHLESTATLWMSILKSITSIETHGAKKTADQPWKEFFEVSIGQELAECPSDFNSADMDFDQVLILVSMHVSAMGKLVANLRKLHANAVQRSKKLKLAIERKEDRAQKKATELMNTDLQKEKREKKLFLDLLI